jgi:hypothetical protein
MPLCSVSKCVGFSVPILPVLAKPLPSRLPILQWPMRVARADKPAGSAPSPKNWEADLRLVRVKTCRCLSASIPSCACFAVLPCPILLPHACLEWTIGLSARGRPMAPSWLICNDIALWSCCLTARPRPWKRGWRLIPESNSSAVTVQEPMRRRARKGAPQAQQVTDRFHLLLILREALKRLFERKHEVLQEEADQQHEFLKSAEDVDTPDKAAPILAPLTPTAIQQQARRARRLSRYEAVMQLHQQGAREARHCCSRWTQPRHRSSLPDCFGLS